MEAKKREPGVVFRISGVGLAWYIIPLPTFAFISCVLISLWKDFDRSTATHCRVPNFLPTISSAIGGYTPQRYIWRICIALHVAPRLMVACMYYRYYTAFPVYKKRELFTFIAAVNSLLHIFENLALVGLSYVSSTENYKIHESSFIAFMVFSEFYMLFTIILYKWSHWSQTMTARDAKSYRLKIRLFIFNLSCLAVAAYLFYRHNKYCEPGVYTAFAAAEYAIVASNIAFHSHMLFYELGEAEHVSLMTPWYEPPGGATEKTMNLTETTGLAQSVNGNFCTCGPCQLHTNTKKRD